MAELTAQPKGSAADQEEARLHQVAASNHARITGADTVAHPQPDGSTKTDSINAVESSLVPTSKTMANTTQQSDSLAKQIPVKIGDTVRLRIVAAGVSEATIAHVTGVSNLDDSRLGENGEPYLTVVYLSSADRVLLGGANWHQGFTRVGPIHHESSASAQAGQEGTVWTDVISDPAKGVSLGSMDMGEDAAQQSYDAEVQRKQANMAGYGPVSDADINYQAATASDAASKGRLAPSQSTRDTTTTIQERINHPMGSVGSPMVPLNNVPGTVVSKGKQSDALLPTPDENDANLGHDHTLSTPSGTPTSVVGPDGVAPQAHSSTDGQSAQQVADSKGTGVLPAGHGAAGIVSDSTTGDGHTIVEDPTGARTSTSEPRYSV